MLEGHAARWPCLCPCKMDRAEFEPSLGAMRIYDLWSVDYLAEAELTPNLRAGEIHAHVGQNGLRAARLRMRGAEDPPPLLDHVLHDGFGFEQVVTCVEIKKRRAAAAR